MNQNIRNPNTPLLSYESFNEYYIKFVKSMTKSNNELTEEEKIERYSSMAFHAYFKKNICKYRISIDLSRFTELKTFHIFQINCKNIINIPQTLEYLDCKSCNIIRLSKMPKSLKILDCRYNLIQKLPSLYNTKVHSVFLSANQLHEIPKIPDTVQKLECYDNNISELPNPLPTSLQILSCSNNDIEILPYLPDNLKVLSAEYNYIQTVPPLPKTLSDYFIANNRITKIKNLPVFLKRITCHNNPIREYEPLPPSVIYANIDGTVMNLGHMD
jgi:Leucine-rich repeat (LRR) protein